MPRHDWMRGDRRPEDWRRDRDEEAYRRQAGDRGPRNDFGQVDYSRDYAYDPRRRAGYRPEEAAQFHDDDYGQADYSNDYGYDSDRGGGFRRFSEDDRDYDAQPRGPRARRPDEDDDRGPSWRERAGAFFGGGPGRDHERAPPRRRGPSDRVLWAVIVERLEDERGLDLRDLEVMVENAEVTLNGTVRRREDKRRIEDIADVDGVRNVQNNLRVRERRWFS